MGVGVRVVGIRLGLQIRKPHDNHGNTNRGIVKFSIVQTIGAPALTITHSGSTVKVLWPYPSTGWTLQQNSDLTTANWTPSGGISNDGVNNFITITSPTGNLFFRLKQ
jgi:hypothetical protein